MTLSTSDLSSLPGVATSADLKMDFSASSVPSAVCFSRAEGAEKRGWNFPPDLIPSSVLGRLAQRQSIGLTHRGPLVQIQYRPPLKSQSLTAIIFSKSSPFFFLARRLQL